MSAEIWFSLIEMVLLGLTLLATVVAAGFVAWQAQRHFALQRSQDFIERFNSPEFAAVRRRAEVWMASGTLPSALYDAMRKEAFRGDRENLATPALDTDTDLTILVNFFQELGTAMQFKTLDRRYTWGVFGGLVSRYWTRLRHYIYHIRYDTGRATLLEDFEWLAGEMRRLDAKRDPNGVSAHTLSDGADAEYLFGYGSLFGPSSIEHTAGRPYAKAELIPAWLNGYARRWSVFERVRFSDEAALTPAVFLNVSAEPGARCSGLLIQLTPEMWEAFDRRERPYDRVDVSHLVVPRPPGRVFTYVGKGERMSLPSDAVIPEKYECFVNEAVSDWGPGMAGDYFETTQASALPRKPGAYTFEP